MEKNTGKKIAKGVGIGILSACLLASLGLNVYQASSASRQNQKVNKFIDTQLERQAKEDQQENTYQEDGYVVAGEYEIRSTTAISDAYKSGDASALDEEDAKTLKLASDVLDKIIKDGMSNYEKELAVYRWMYKNIGQGSSVVALPGANSSAFTPYGVLTSRNSVCVGYATTFRLFMNMLDMDCHIVHNEYHSWDMVQLDDGEWYQLDIYSDVSSHVEYMNFNMTDQQARNGHEWDGSALPEAKGVKYSYAVQNCKEVKNLYAIPAKVKKAIDKKKSSLFFRFKDALSTDELGIADPLVEQINMAFMMVPGLESYNVSGSWYQDENGAYILGLYLTNYSESGATSRYDENSKEWKKIVEAISKTFGVSTESMVTSDNSYMAEDSVKAYDETAQADGPTVVLNAAEE